MRQRAPEAPASPREESQPLLRLDSRLSVGTFQHQLPCTEMTEDEEERMPVSFQHQHILDQLEGRGYMQPSKHVAKPLTGCAQARARVPLYASATVVRIFDICTQDSTFKLRVRLHLLWEDDLYAKGLGDAIKQGMPSNGSSFYVNLDSGQAMEALMEKGVVAPQVRFTNAMSYEDADVPMMRIYPRPEASQNDMVYWNQMWDITFRGDFKLACFPFDHQSLTMEMNLSDSRSFDLFHLVVHAVQFRRTVLDMAEWTLHVPSVQRKSPQHRCVDISLIVSRKPGYYLWNIVFMVASMSYLTFLAFISPWDATSDRVSICLTLILTTVAYKFTVNDQLPKLNYQTLLDRYMLLTQFGLCGVALALCAAQILDHCQEHLEIPALVGVDTNSLDLWMLGLSFVVYTLVQTIWFCTAYWRFNNVRKDKLQARHFVGKNPQTGQVGPRQWLCFHFAETFFLPVDRVAPEAYTTGAGGLWLWKSAT